MYTPGTSNVDIWVYDLARGTRSRLTFESSRESFPAWSPDGQWIAYSSARKGPLDLYRRRSDGSGQEELLFASPEDKAAQSVSPDGRFLAFATFRATGNDIWILPLTGDRKPFPLIQTPANEVVPEISPDGRWLAYQSDESNRPEVYVTRFPSGEGKWQVSTSFGIQPRWSRKGDELYYIAQPDFALMAVSVKTQSGFELSEPVRLFQIEPFTGQLYDTAPDGRFLVNAPEARGDMSPLTVVMNWAAELKKQP
jgi:Tol biopolymer transport system component